MGDECSPVEVEIGTISKRTTCIGRIAYQTRRNSLKRRKYMKCNQCGKTIPSTNQHSINYHGTSMIVCGKHYSQYLKYGKFLDESQKTCFDSNEYEITNEGTWIYCFNRKNEPSGKFLIDTEDLEKVLTRKWRYWKGRYYTGNYHPVTIHVWLLHPENNEVVDHINGNPADNRKSNLRITTQAKNTINKAIPSNNKSGIMGVSWDKQRNKWISEIKMDSIKCYLGRYNELEDAVFARYVAELALFKEFRSTRNDDKILEYVTNCQKQTEIKMYVDKRLQDKYFSKSQSHT